MNIESATRLVVVEQQVGQIRDIVIDVREQLHKVVDLAQAVGSVQAGMIAMADKMTVANADIRAVKNWQTKHEEWTEGQKTRFETQLNAVNVDQVSFRSRIQGQIALVAGVVTIAIGMLSTVIWWMAGKVVETELKMVQSNAIQDERINSIQRTLTINAAKEAR